MSGISAASIFHAKLYFLSVKFGDHAPLVYGFLLFMDEDELVGIAAAMTNSALLVILGAVLATPLD